MCFRALVAVASTQLQPACQHGVPIASVLVAPSLINSFMVSVVSGAENASIRCK